MYTIVYYRSIIPVIDGQYNQAQEIGGAIYASSYIENSLLLKK